MTMSQTGRNLCGNPSWDSGFLSVWESEGCETGHRWDFGAETRCRRRHHHAAEAGGSSSRRGARYNREREDAESLSVNGHQANVLCDHEALP